MSEENVVPKIVAGKAALIARRYARALFDLADSEGQMDAVVADIRLLRDLLASDMAFRRLVFGRHLKHAEQDVIVRKMIEIGGFNPLVRGFLELLSLNHRLEFLPAILRAFKADLAFKKGVHTAEVTSAQPLSEAQTAALAEGLGRAIGGNVEIVASQNPALLGGMKVQLGSFLIDSSVRGKLALIEKQLKTQDAKGAA